MEKIIGFFCPNLNGFLSTGCVPLSQCPFKRRTKASCPFKIRTGCTISGHPWAQHTTGAYARIQPVQLYTVQQGSLLASSDFSSWKVTNFNCGYRPSIPSKYVPLKKIEPPLVYYSVTEPQIDEQNKSKRPLKLQFCNFDAFKTRTLTVTLRAKLYPNCLKKTHTYCHAAREAVPLMH